MAENHLRLTMYVNKEVTRPIAAKQYDAASRFLDVTLLNDDGTPIDLKDHRVRFNARKPDKTTVFNDAVVTDAKNGRFTVELTSQTLAIGGKYVSADISVHTRDEECVLTTRTFSIYVEATQRDDAALESINEYGAILTLMQRIIDLYGYIKQDIAQLQVFDFDNIMALEEVKKTITYSENTVTETIKDANMDSKIAERVSVFNADGTISQTMEVYGRDGATVIKRGAKTTEFDADGTIAEETSLGYNDYSMQAAYLMLDSFSAVVEGIMYENAYYPGLSNVKEALDTALQIPREIGWKPEED